MHPILITGVGRAGQVGQSVAFELAARGFPLLLVSRREEELRARLEELRAAGHRAEGFAADLADTTSADSLAASMRDLSGGRLGAAVMLAGGFAMSGPVAAIDVEGWRRLLDINLTTAMLATRAALPLLRPEGALVYVASAAALPGAPSAEMSAYTAAKAGVLALMRTVAEEERRHGVRANAIAPSSIRTADNMAAMGENAAYVERETVARVIAWLCGPESAGVTGQVVGL